MGGVILRLLLSSVFFFFLFVVSLFAQERHYVGTSQCASCHEEEYQSYQKYAKKARSFQAVEKMKHHLSPEEVKRCYRCHTTGYGEPSGFVDEKTTPDLKNVGCEECHGPGSAHVESEDPKDIYATAEQIRGVCQKCHTQEMVNAFRFRPLIHGGAH